MTRLLALLALAAAPCAFGATCGLSALHFPQRLCGGPLFWENTYVLLHTHPGERVMRPDLGIDWGDLCFGPSTPAAFAAMEAEIARQVEANVGLHVRSVRITPVPGDAALTVAISYIDPDTSELATMSVPYLCGAQG